MRSLPGSISGLTGLKMLRLEHCGLERLPGSLGQLVQLKRLYIDHCESLVELPASLSQLKGGLGLKFFTCAGVCFYACRPGPAHVCGTCNMTDVHVLITKAQVNQLADPQCEQQQA
jgi:hypothetical protein